MFRWRGAEFGLLILYIVDAFGYYFAGLDAADAVSYGVQRRGDDGETADALQDDDDAACHAALGRHVADLGGPGARILV